MLSLITFVIGVSCTATASKLYNAKIIFHHSSGRDTYELLDAGRIFQHSNFLRSRQTVLYSHGYRDTTDGDHIKSLVKAYKNTNSFNILLFDWRQLALSKYLLAVWNMEKLGEGLAKFILKGTAQGYAINNWHLLGHSLGAHMSGITGRQIKLLSNGSLILPRISGLDPAGPGYYGLLLGPQPISRSDAIFVDIIHTDAGMLGADTNTGTVDFWPNKGLRPQPGCSFFKDITGCSHSRAMYYWIESVQNRGEEVFIAKCESALTTKICMGIDCPMDTPPGKYVLSTRNKPPYSLS